MISRLARFSFALLAKHVVGVKEKFASVSPKLWVNRSAATASAVEFWAMSFSAIQTRTPGLATGKSLLWGE